MPIRDDARSLFTLGASPVRWPVALQAAVAMGIPAVGFALAGRADLGLLASSGAFTALYLTNRSRRTRARLLPLIAAGLIASSVLGVATSGSLVLSLASVALVAVASATLGLGFRLGPPGALFFVLVVGVSGHLAAGTGLGGAGIDGVLVIALLALGCLIAYLVVLAPLLLPSARRRDASKHEATVAPTHVRFALDSASRIILVRLAVGSIAAAVLSAPLGIDRAYWVVMTVVAILQNGHRIRLTGLRGVQRVLGTLVGVGVFALIQLADPGGVWVALLLVALQFIVEIVVIRNYGLALVFITPLALTIAAQAHAAPAQSLIVDRVSDTLIGAGIALVVLLWAALLRRVPRERQ